MAHACLVLRLQADSLPSQKTPEVGWIDSLASGVHSRYHLIEAVTSRDGFRQLSHFMLGPVDTSAVAVMKLNSIYFFPLVITGNNFASSQLPWNPFGAGKESKQAPV